MAELQNTGESQYDVLVDGRIIGQVWNWHGSWSAQVGGETYHSLKSRKEAIARVEYIHRLSQ
jgi:hypothetical protein